MTIEDIVILAIELSLLENTVRPNLTADIRIQNIFPKNRALDRIEGYLKVHDESTISISTVEESFKCEGNIIPFTTMISSIFP